MNTARKVIFWILAIFIAFWGLLFMPSLGSLLMLEGAFILLPIKKLDEFWEKIKFKNWLRVTIALLSLLIGFIIAPSSKKDEPAPAPEPAVSVSEENKQEPETLQEDRDAVLATEWHYGDAIAIDVYFKFTDDGRFKQDSQGGHEWYGDYEIVGKTIKLHYDNGDEKELTIVNSELLKDWEGMDVTPVTYDDYDWYDEDD